MYLQQYCVDSIALSLCKDINYPHNKWITTRELARKIDQIEQYTHYHQSVEGKIQGDVIYAEV